MTRESLTERAHHRLHQLPGMPEHSESPRLNRRRGLPNRPLRNHPLRNRPLPNRPLNSPRLSHGHKEPKVLVGWQNAIARFLCARSS
jgi:hypothetical protein